MNKLEKLIKELREKMARFQELRDKDSLTDAEKTEKRSLMDKCKAIKEEIDEIRAEQALIDDLDKSFTDPPEGGNPGQGHDGAGHRSRQQFQVGGPPVYRSFGEQLTDLICAERGTAGATEARERLAKNDKRTKDILKEGRSSAQSVKTPEDGGGLVQTDYAFDIIDQGFNNGVIISKCSVRESTSQANAMTLFGLDEKTRADGVRYGGIQVYTKREEEQFDSSKAKFASIELRVNKITGLLYLTDEIIEDAGVLEGEVRGLFPKAMAFKVQDLLYRGKGNGEPVGILNSKALLSIAKETDQAAKTINAANISKMKASCTGSAEFFGNRDIIPQLDALYRTHDSNKVTPLFKQTSMDTGVLDGIPITFVEQAETLGTAGDLTLADWAQYVILRKGGIKEAESLHFKFDTGLKAIKWTMRLDGMSRVTTPLTPYKGTNKISPFVVLAARG